MRDRATLGVVLDGECLIPGSPVRADDNMNDLEHGM